MAPKLRDRLEAVALVAPDNVVSEEKSMVPTVVVRDVSVGNNNRYC